jgi:nucleoside-diphosphate-sugar epimerase
MNILKILILGSNGFFGKNIKFLLKNDNYDLHYLERKDIDILDKQKLNELFTTFRPDVVINCCGMIGSSESNKEMNQYEILNTNVELNMNILNCCNDNNIKKLFVFSTYRMFSSSVNNKCNEENLLNYIDINITNNNKGYLLSKIFMHLQIDLLIKSSKTKIICFILPNIFGSHDNFSTNGRIVSSIICKINSAKRDDTDIHINVNQNTRVNLIYINDIIYMIDKCIQNDNIDGNIIILNKNANVTLYELCKTIQSMMNYRKNIHFDNAQFCVESNIMKLELCNFKKYFPNFEFTDLKTSLKDTIDYFISTKIIN